MIAKRHHRKIFRRMNESVSTAIISPTFKSSRLNRLMVEEISSIFEVKSLLLLSIVTERLVDGDCCCLPLKAGDEGRRVAIVLGIDVRFKRGVFVVERE